MSFKEKIEHELQHRNKIEDAANLLSRLNIASEGKAAMSELEWTGKYTEKSNDETMVELDSDDESNPLKILAQVSFTFNYLYSYYSIYHHSVTQIYFSPLEVVFTTRKSFILYQMKA